jgi:hypothetical protein
MVIPVKEQDAGSSPAGPAENPFFGIELFSVNNSWGDRLMAGRLNIPSPTTCLPASLLLTGRRWMVIMDQLAQVRTLQAPLECRAGWRGLPPPAERQTEGWTPQIGRSWACLRLWPIAHPDFARHPVNGAARRDCTARCTLSLLFRTSENSFCVFDLAARRQIKNTEILFSDRYLYCPVRRTQWRTRFTTFLIAR